MKTIILFGLLMSTTFAFAQPEVPRLQIINKKTNAQILGRCSDTPCETIYFTLREAGQSDENLLFRFNLNDVKAELKDRVRIGHFHPIYFPINSELWNGDWGTFFTTILVTVCSAGTSEVVITAADLIAAPFEGIAEGISAIQYRIAANKVKKAIESGKPLKVNNFRFNRIVKLLSAY